MTIGLKRLASVERNFLREELNWLNAGGRVISPSGDDITPQRMEQLKVRIADHDKEIAAAI